MKLKNLKPSARIKRYYMLIEASGKEEVEKAILDYIGILGWTKAAPFFVQQKKMNEIILAVERKSVNDVRAAFSIDGKIRVLRVSGTLKGLSG